MKVKESIKKINWYHVTQITSIIITFVTVLALIPFIQLHLQILSATLQEGIEEWFTRTETLIVTLLHLFMWVYVVGKIFDMLEKGVKLMKKEKVKGADKD